ncbi:MAG TPA: sporulation protein YqfD [Clostridiales bacterium]|jgi:similar to stage IV sporulation protein|nr:sporulation protein YqfD [Clostridiales bacterium]
MFQKVADFVFGKNKIEITGLNLDRLLNALAASGVIMRNICRVTHRIVTFDVTDKMLKKAFGSIDPSQYNVRLLSRRSLKNSFINFCKIRPGLLIGLVLTIIIIAVFNMFVWDVKVYGNEQIGDKTVFEALESLGIKKGKLINDIDRKKLAQELNSRLDQASLVSVEIKGITLIINIKERILRPQEEDEKTADEIISGYDCQIVKIALLNGTALVKVGDIVKKGEVLAAAYEEYYEGSQKVKEPIRAEGEFWGKVWFSHTRYYATDGVKYIRTGAKKTKFFWEIFGFKNSKNYQPVYNFFETESSQTKINFLIPLIIHKTVYYEQKPQLIALTLEQARELYGREVLEVARQKTPKDAVVLNSFIKANEENGLIRIDAVFETELKVGARQKFTS